MTCFKNYAEARFTLGDRFNLISGLNGTGKTNLLDAIYYLCVGRSFFSSQDQRVVSQGESFFRLEGKVSRGDARHQVIIKVRPGTLKEIWLDGIHRPRISDHLGFFPVLFSAPKDVDLIMGPGQSRRKYFDHLICQIDPGYLHALMKYNHLLQMRQAALKQGMSELRRMIQTYDEQMSPLAQIIFEKRQWLMTDLARWLQETYTHLSDGKETIRIVYDSQLEKYPYAVLADMNWESDKNTGRTLAGIHKDDFDLFIKELPAKEYGSQGQIKSLIFALHLSKYHILREQTGFNPILILDDIFDKLDEQRLHRLMEILMADDFGQVFISDTSPNRVGHLLPGSMLHHIK